MVADKIALGIKRLQVEALLHRERNWVQRCLDLVDNMFVFLDSTGRILLINRKGLEVLDYEEEELLGMDWFDNTLPERIRDEVREGFHRLLAGGVESAWYHENPVVTRSGEERIIAWHNSVLTDDDGRITGVLGSGKDITGLRKVVLDLQKTNRLLQILRACNQTIVGAKEETEFWRQICRSLVTIRDYRMAWVGYALDEADRTVRPVAQAGGDDNYLQEIKISWAAAEKGHCPVGAAIRTREVVVSRNIMLEPAFVPCREMTQERGPCSIIALPLVAGDQNFGALAIYTTHLYDFTKEEIDLLKQLAAEAAYGILSLRNRAELNRTEKAFRESEGKLRALFEAAVDGILLVEAASRAIINGNLAASLMLGYSLDELPGLTVDHIHPEESLPYVLEQFARVRKREIAIAANLPVKRKDGTVFYADIAGASIIIEGQEYLIGIFRDITRRKQTEEQLRQARKMEAIGTLAGGIAHDFNSILSAIFGYSDLAREDVNNPSKLLEDLEQMRFAAKRARDLVKQILAFSRPSEQRKQPLQPFQVIEEALRLLRASIPSSIAINQQMSSTGFVLADYTQMYQIILNLCTNASHAMQEKGGVLGVSLKDTEIKEDDQLADPGMVPGRYLLLEVTDTGQGMDEQIKSMIFKPYFSTKKAEEGSGLGLYMVHEIVRDHHGYITVASVPGVGTCFKVYLPALRAWPEEDTEEMSETHCHDQVA